MKSERTDLPRWEYATPGPLRERLTGLTLVGRKTTTFGLAVFEAIDDDPIPRSGQRWTLVGSDDAELAIVEVVAHERMRLDDVPWDLVEREGESFVSVQDWREQHERFWAQFLPEIRTSLRDPMWSLTDDTVVTCSSLRVVEHLRGHRSTRFAVVECIVAPSDVEWVSGELIEHDATGIEEVDGGPTTYTTNGDHVEDGFVLLRAGFASDGAAVAAEGALDRTWRPRFEVLLGDAWLDAWREHFESQRIGQVIVVADWEGAQSAPLASDDSTTVIRLDPARSFGTGAHPSTRLMIEALQRIDLRNARVLDVGCGSGVLSVCAVRLGAASAHGTDIDDAALDVTLENAERNAVGGRCTTSRDIPGSNADNAGPNTVGTDMHTYDVVLANILAPVLIDLAPQLARALAPGAKLLLAGIIEEQVERVVAAFPLLTRTDELSDGVWRCVQLEARRA